MKKSYLSGLRVLTWAMLLAAGSFVSCSDDNEGKDGPTPPPDPVELNDQFEYDGGDPVDIKSAIYEVEDTDLYTFYLSPSNGVTGMDDMTAVNDFLRIAVRNPKGTVNTETDEFEIAYKDIAVNRNTLKTDVEKVSLQADLVAETSKLNLHIEVTMKSGKTLLARYNNTCTEAVPAELTNQYELDKTVTGIGSAVEWHDAAAAATTYCFYADPDVTAPSEETAGLQITVADGVETAEVDLATADAEKIRIACGEFESGEGMTGTLSLAKSGSKLTLTLDAEKGASRLRARLCGRSRRGLREHEQPDGDRGRNVRDERSEEGVPLPERRHQRPHIRTGRRCRGSRRTDEGPLRRLVQPLDLPITGCDGRFRKAGGTGADLRLPGLPDVGQRQSRGRDGYGDDDPGRRADLPALLGGIPRGSETRRRMVRNVHDRQGGDRHDARRAGSAPVSRSSRRRAKRSWTGKSRRWNCVTTRTSATRIRAT